MSDVETKDGTILRNGVEYGCHLDLSDGEKPDACVISSSDHWGCVYATFKSGRKRTSQWTCSHWKPV